MAVMTSLPAARAAFIDPSGRPTPQFYRFLETLATAQAGNVSPDEITAINAQLAELQAEIAALPSAEIPKLQVTYPILSQGLLQNGFAKLTLNQPGDSGAGALKGVTLDAWGRVTGTTDATITGTAGRVTVANGDAAAGSPTIDLAPVADTGGGSLLKFIRDAWGRITGTSTPTTADLAEGANLYYTDARADARITLQKGQPNGIATLDANSKLDAGQLPALAITETFVVSTQAAMLALAAQQGDVCVRTDLHDSFILTTDDPTVLTNWQELETPGGGVASFNGRTGSVTPASGDYTLDQVADGTGRFAVVNGGGLNAVSVVDPNKKALIDFTQTGHTGKTLDNIGDSATRFAAAEAGADKTSGKSLTVLTDRNLDNLADTNSFVRSVPGYSETVVENAGFTAPMVSGNVPGWAPSDAGVTSINIRALTNFPGTNALDFTTNAAFIGMRSTKKYACAAGDYIAFSAQGFSWGGLQYRVSVWFFQADGTHIAGGDPVGAIGGTYVTATAAGPAPAGAAYFQLQFDTTAADRVTFRKPRLSINDVRVAGSGSYGYVNFADNTAGGHAGKNLDNIPPVSYTVASLPASGTVGQIAYASNGRKAGQTTGAGTGVPVWWTGAAWFTFYGNTQVQA